MRRFKLFDKLEFSKQKKSQCSLHRLLKVGDIGFVGGGVLLGEPFQIV